MLITILLILGIGYLILGFVYAVYILFVGIDPFYVFPINVIGGPIMIVYIVIKTAQGKKIRI
jgi:hypothetical protein